MRPWIVSIRMALQGGKLRLAGIGRAAKHDMTSDSSDAFASRMGLVELDELPLLADEAKRRLEGD